MMDDALNWIAGKYTEFLNFIVEKIDLIFEWAWGLLKDVIAWCFESLLNVVIWSLSQFDLSGIPALQSWQGLPEDVKNVMGLLGVGQAATIIVGAVGIRIVMQLVPFTRLGS